MHLSLDDQKLYAMILEAVKRVKADFGVVPDKWIDSEEAMELLRITSKTTLQKLRDEGKITYSQPEKKMILYDRDSIIAYIEKHIKKPFA